MTPKKIMIIDDEELARLRIVRYLEKAHPDFLLIEAEDGVCALEKIKDDCPDVVLLDIEMPELNGFDVLQNLGERSFSVIFQTAHDEFAIKAFEVNACDYLLKPFTDERLELAIEKALKVTNQTAVDGLEKHLVEKERFLERLIVKVGSRSKVVETGEIRYFTSEDHATMIHLNDRDFVYDQSLNFLEQRLNPKEFIRLHRNVIVKISQIKTLDRVGGLHVIVDGGEKLRVSRERAKNLRKLLHS